VDESPLLYRVSYSGRVREALRELVLHAREVNLGEQVLAAIREIDNRLHLYPQFGQPLRDLSVQPAQLWIGVVKPLVVLYVLGESSRQVSILHPITPLPRCGL